MAYVAVKGGEKAIRNAHKLNDKKRRGDTDVPEITVEQIKNQMHGSVDKVMNEGNLYDRDLAALAIKQSTGDLIEAIFLLRAYRTTLTRLAISKPIDTAKMVIRRRVSATYKDVPGGQILGPTFDYTHRLLDFALTGGDNQVGDFEGDETCLQEIGGESSTPHVASFLECKNDMFTDADDGDEPGDVTVKPLNFPGSRAERIQQLIRGDEGFINSVAYSAIRGYGGGTHPYVGETRIGDVEVVLCPEEIGFDIVIGDVEVTECEMFSKLYASENETPKLTRGYGLVMGAAERKAMGVSIVDRSLRFEEFGGANQGVPQDIEYVMSHCDPVDADGFLSHLRLPHYVDFQADLVNLKLVQEEYARRKAKTEKDAQ